MSNQQPSPGTGTLDPTTTALWLVLVVSLVGNTVTSFTDAGVALNVALGLTTLVAGGLLVARRMARSS